MNGPARQLGKRFWPILIAIFKRLSTDGLQRDILICIILIFVNPIFI